MAMIRYQIPVILAVLTNELSLSFIVIDFNPDLIKKLIRQKVSCLYGDISDCEIINQLNLKDVEMIISTVPDFSDNLYLIKKIREVNDKTIVFVTANSVDAALELYNKGADYVILPHFLGGDHASLILEQVTGNFAKVIGMKSDHISELKRRKHLGHEHPIHLNMKHEIH